MVRAVTEASDTESGSSPSASRMARRSRSSISSTAGSSGEEGGPVRWAGWWDSDCISLFALPSRKLSQIPGLLGSICLECYGLHICRVSGLLVISDFN